MANFVSLGMEFYAILLIAALFGFSAYRLKRRYSLQLLSEQNTSSSLALRESQLEQENLKIAEELEAKRKEAEQFQHQLEALAKEMDARLSHESNQHVSLQEQLKKTKELVNASSAQLHETIEAQSVKLQQMQEHLHDEQVTRKRSEEIFSLKETEYREKIAELNAIILSLKNELSSTAEGLNNELSARHVIERDKTKIEQELLEKTIQLESELSALHTTHRQLNEAFQEENRIRLATEHALQESKEKLYAVIRNLETKLTEREEVISIQNDRQHEAETTIENLEHAVNTILDTVPVPVFLVNDEGICSFINTSLQTTLGYSCEDITGRHFSKLFPENERTFYQEQWVAAENRVAQFKGETHIAASTGDIISVEINIAEIFNKNGAKTYVGFIFDKTHERDAAKHFREAKHREEELAELKSRFISMVTNQLRSALVTVATNAELLERFMFKWSDEKRYRAFFRINDSLKQMLNLLRNVESSTVVNYVPVIKEINLESLVQSTAKETAADLETKHRFILSEQGNISSVKIDEAVVRTVLSHLLSNAFKFSPDDREVKLHIERTNSTCTFTVEDRGIGIPPSEQSQLFQSFFRGSNVGNIHGTGLGLTIVQLYVQRAGGTVTIDSQMNKGTTVKITLPISP